jgi:hypothetical protein
MRTNNKQVRNAIKQHILDCVTDINGNTFDDLKEACNRLNNEFIGTSNYPYNLQKFPNDQNRFSDFLCGLPFNFLYSNYDIANYLNELTGNDKDFDFDKTLKLYHYLIYSETQKNL